MTSLRHNVSPDDTCLDAARDAILAVGWTRTTLTDVARRAGVSRMTIYRRWPDMRSLLGDLMTREWSTIGDQGLPTRGSTRSRVAAGVAAMVRSLRDNELFAKIIQVDPELLLPYLLERRGRTQDALLTLLTAGIAEGQRDGTIRKGNATVLARSVLLTAHGFALSATTMTGPGPGEPGLRRLDAELTDLVDRYLAP
jgi:AcrR family transcriptional regulator